LLRDDVFFAARNRREEIKQEMKALQPGIFPSHAKQKIQKSGHRPEALELLRDGWCLVY
jgi:hypothetical protein